MDDIIIIILTLIFILASVIGQKKKPVKNIEPPLPRAEDDLWTLPGEHITATTARTAEEGAMQPSDRKLFPGETQLISEKETDSYGTKSDLKTAQELKHPDIKNKFSLKKAVIYSEILNRKYL